MTVSEFCIITFQFQEGKWATIGEHHQTTHKQTLAESFRK